MRITSQKGFSGIDQRKNFCNELGVAAEMVNFRVTDSGSLTRRQGINFIFNAEENIDGIWSGDIGTGKIVVFASGSKLYKTEHGKFPAEPQLIGNIGTGECNMFEFNGYLYIMNSDYYGKYDGETLQEVEGYIPLVALSCTPSGEGEIFEQINLITDKRRQLFSGDGKALSYVLAERDIDKVDSITVDGENYEGQWNYNYETGTVVFPGALSEGLNNIEIVYSKSSDVDTRKTILDCRKFMLFGGNSDGRIFLWGNTAHPNCRYHSDLADGVPSVEYFPANAFTIIGNSRINCIVQQYDKQLIFTEDQAFYSYCELREDSLGNTYASFPVFSLNDGKGCIFETKGCVIDNNPITLCSDGLNRWESTSVDNEKNAVCFSMPICRSMERINGGDKSEMRMFDFQANRELFFIYGDDAFVYNYGNGSWYMYDEFGGKYHSVFEKTLYFARENKLCAFGNDIECDLERTCNWTSPFIENNKVGNCDLIGFYADVHVEGASNMRFDFARSGEAFSHPQELSFSEGTDRFLRVSCRPRLKRALPFRISFTDMGPGRTTLHGIIIKTRDKERSNRDGIL